MDVPGTYATGTNPAVGINKNGDVYSVYNGANDTWIRYRSGKIQGGKITWSQEWGLEFNGARPSIDVSDDNRVVVFGYLLNGTISYRVGRINPESWGDVTLLTSNAVEPSVSIGSSGQAIVAYRDPAGNTNPLMLRRGTLSDKSANWTGATKYGTGLYPAIGLNSLGNVVEVHKSATYNDRWFNSGVLSGSGVSWSGTHKYGGGEAPKVAVNADGMVFEAHQVGTSIWTVAGSMSNAKIDWSSDVEYGGGRAPSVAINDSGTVVMVYMNKTSNELHYAVGTIAYVPPPPPPPQKKGSPPPTSYTQCKTYCDKYVGYHVEKWTCNFLPAHLLEGPPRRPDMRARHP